MIKEKIRTVSAVFVAIATTAVNLSLPVAAYPYDFNYANRCALLREDVPEPQITDEVFDISQCIISENRLNSYFGSNAYNYHTNLSYDGKQAYVDMYNALKSDPGAEYCVSSISNLNDIYEAFIALVMDCPEYVGLRTPTIYTSSQSAGSRIVFNYCDGQAAGQTAVNSYNMVESTVDAVVNRAAGKTTYEKLRFFAEYMCDTVTYDTVAANTLRGENCWNAYGSLINGKGVCESYAEGFKLLCDKANIPCISVVSDTHEWNAVYIEKAWYYVDTTWMDTEITGSYNYDWFLTGTDYASDSNHVLSPYAVLDVYGVSGLKYPEISSKAYVYENENPIQGVDVNSVNNFVERLYTKILNRASDPAGKDNWVGQLLNGSSAVDVSLGFVYSDEFKNRNLSNEETVTVFYNTFLDRTPDEGGLRDWTSKLDNGCSLDFLFRGFTQSEEFSNICNSYGIKRGNFDVSQSRDKNVDLTAYVARMYTKALGRSYDVDGLNNWTGLYVEGKTDADGIAEGFIYSEEFSNRALSDEEYVETLYQTFFDRNSDPIGKSNWLGQLRSGASRSDVLNGFLGSEEYANLVARFGV